MSAYRDGYRINNIKDYGDYSIFTIEKKLDDTHSNCIILQEANKKLERFFGQAKLKLIRTEFGSSSVKEVLNSK